MTAEKAEPVARAERLRLELEKIAWMDEFLDASGAKAMMQIARDAVKADETLVPPPSEAGMELLTLADDLEGLADLLSYENTNSDAGFDRICLRAAAAIRVLSETKPVQMGCTMTDQAPELLPCPFCGGVPMLTAYQGNYNKAPSWCVDCRECDLSLDGDATPEEAVKRWNTCAAPVPRYEAEPVAWRWRHANDASQLWKYQTQPIESHSEYLQVEPLYAAPARRCDAQNVRDTTIEECAKVCDLHAQWANGHHRENEAPESTHNQLFATIDNSATDCAELIRALSKTGPVRGGSQRELLQKIDQVSHIGFTVKKRDPIADSLAKDHLIECRHSTNDTETWWITDKGKTYLGAGCTALAETKPAQWDASTEVITDEQLAISGLNKYCNRLYNALRDIISIAKDAQATDTLGDIVKRAEEALP